MEHLLISGLHCHDVVGDVLLVEQMQSRLVLQRIGGTRVDVDSLDLHSLLGVGLEDILISELVVQCEGVVTI